MNLSKKVRAFIVENLFVLDDEDDFLDSDNIFELGYVNSLFAMKLLNYVETEFDLTVENEEMDIQNFSSINAIVHLIEKKLGDSIGATN
ncbi:MAG: phosphopantetheine-binding protein [Bacteroidota bacterium]